MTMRWTRWWPQSRSSGWGTPFVRRSSAGIVSSWRHLMKINDSQLYAILAGLLDGEASVSVTPKNSEAQAYSVEIALDVHDNHRGDSPDAVLHITLTIDHPLLPKLKLQIPLPVEGE